MKDKHVIILFTALTMILSGAAIRAKQQKNKLKSEIENIIIPNAQRTLANAQAEQAAVQDSIIAFDLTMANHAARFPHYDDDKVLHALVCQFAKKFTEQKQFHTMAYKNELKRLARRFYKNTYDFFGEQIVPQHTEDFWYIVQSNIDKLTVAERTKLSNLQKFANYYEDYAVEWAFDDLMRTPIRNISQRNSVILETPNGKFNTERNIEQNERIEALCLDLRDLMNAEKEFDVKCIDTNTVGKLAAHMRTMKIGNKIEEHKHTAINRAAKNVADAQQDLQCLQNINNTFQSISDTKRVKTQLKQRGKLY